jgi:putative oxidoreductase
MPAQKGEGMAARNTRLIFPALGKFYDAWSDYAELLLRVVAGLILPLLHGLPKIGILGSGNPAGVAGGLEKSGYYPGIFWAYVIILSEIVGGAFLALGLFTRLAAAVLIIEFINVVYVDFANRGTAGARYSFVLLIVYIFFLIRGGGPYSLDRKLGREF